MRVCVCVCVQDPFPHEFMELEPDIVDNLIELNITSTTLMTRIVLPQMEKRKKGAVKKKIEKKYIKSTFDYLLLFIFP